MYIAVFSEFAHPEVLEEVKRRGICDVDIASEPNTMATSPEELKAVRTNVKLITINHAISAMRSAFDTMTPEQFAELSKLVDEKVEQLVALGFQLVHRNPVTSAGCPMPDRVILAYPE